MRQKIISFSPEDHEIKFIHDSQVRSRIIYVVFLVSIIALTVSLPLIKVSVSVQSRGIVRPVSEIAEIRVIPSAPVLAVYISEGQYVEKGDTLLILTSEGVESKLAFTRRELETVQNSIFDLRNLTAETNVTLFHSALYRTQNANFRKKLSEIDFRIKRANKEVERQVPLYENQLISRKEYEEMLFYRDQLENERKIVESSQMSQWRADLAKCCSDCEGYISLIDQLEKQRDLYVIRSPVNGTIESFSGIYPGCNLQSGQVVAAISPNNTMIAEVYVSARSVGLLSTDMPVKMQIDAFNYNEWGMITGKITGIPDDCSLINNIPVFKVKCSLDNTCLRLKNGTPGLIKKGMTMNVRFMVAKRSIFQLLYEKSDDWLNPARNFAIKQ
jgi:membrane fusion protein, peptide pheromone/bacteriocin exporter